MPIYMQVSKGGVSVIPGESKAPGHEGWIEISSLSFGALERSMPVQRGGIATPSISEIVVTKTTDSSSPKLLNWSNNGGPTIMRIELTKYVSGKEQVYLSYTLVDSTIESFRTGGHAGGESPTESLTLSFTKITFDYAGRGQDVSQQAMLLTGHQPEGYDLHGYGP
jgi:type VI secretion system secreted protein Hcp